MNYDVIAIGSSAGGIDALKSIFAKFKCNGEVAIIIVQHLAANSKSYMSHIINDSTNMNVYEIEDKMIIKKGCVYIVPPNYHALMEKDGTFTLATFEKVCFARPSIDVTFESVSDVFKERVIGVILTGANCDGGHGLKSIKDMGGYTLVQNYLSAEASEMPRYATEYVKPNEILDIDLIGERLNQLIRKMENTNVE
ncbi:MAG: chemotaxis protein CheB [Acidaminobacteraceae bacterium]